MLYVTSPQGAENSTPDFIQVARFYSSTVNVYKYIYSAISKRVLYNEKVYHSTGFILYSSIYRSTTSQINNYKSTEV